MKRLDFLYQFTDALDSEFCDELIQNFESSKNTLKRNDGGTPNFTELNISSHNKNLSQKVEQITKQCYDLYCHVIHPYGGFHGDFEFEGIAIKKYQSNSDDRFDDHVDVSTLGSSHRFLSFLFYLNDNFTGGRTVFHPNHVVAPIKGSVLVFPPYWMYPHRGEKVDTGNKYIMSVYLNWRN